MLLTKDLIEGADEQYREMLTTVNIPNFTKAISCFANAPIKNLDEEVLKEYLYTWAKNKYKFWQMFGNKTRVDIPIEYSRPAHERRDIFIDLKREFPAFTPWIEGIETARANRLKRYELSREFVEWIQRGWPDFKYEDAAISKFFLHRLNAPMELVNNLMKVYENEKVSATFTLSIDPIDIMFASETPYWNSCYRLNTIDHGDTHADGLVAALLDSSTIITYTWNEEGKYNFTSSDLKYEFKDIRYKKLRIWVSIEPTTMESFYMALIYPKKEEMGEEFEKMIRLEIERVIGNHIKNYRSLA